MDADAYQENLLYTADGQSRKEVSFVLSVILSVR